MAEPVMDEYELLEQLNHFYKVRLYLDEEKRELMMHKHLSASLPEPVLEAIKEHREFLPKRILFVDVLARFDRWMDERAGQARLGSVDRAKARWFRVGRYGLYLEPLLQPSSDAAGPGYRLYALPWSAVRSAPPLETHEMTLVRVRRAGTVLAAYLSVSARWFARIRRRGRP